ncbi:MAG: hypothetical protein NT105_06095 [Verrucomicrobia bacterium]|nr:hypothetical protein [Verrucomicrobiota bacterium]
MNDIECLEKFIRQRKRWKDWDSYPNMSDFKRLQLLVNAETEGMGLFIIGLVAIDFGSSFGLFGIGSSVCVLGFVIYLFVDRSKNRRLLEIFQSTAIQNASDVIDEIKRRNADQAQQDKPAPESVVVGEGRLSADGSR